jgi:hypothetical protein
MTYYILLGGFFGTEPDSYDELGTYESIEDLMAAIDGSTPLPHEDMFEYDFYTHREITQ